MIGMKKGTISDLAANLLVPGITAAKLALVEPHFDAGCAQGRAEALCGLMVLRGIAQKDRVIRVGHGRPRWFWSVGPKGCRTKGFGATRALTG